MNSSIASNERLQASDETLPISNNNTTNSSSSHYSMTASTLLLLKSQNTNHDDDDEEEENDDEMFPFSMIPSSTAAFKDDHPSGSEMRHIHDLRPPALTRSMISGSHGEEANSSSRSTTTATTTSSSSSSSLNNSHTNGSLCSSNEQLLVVQSSPLMMMNHPHPEPELPHCESGSHSHSTTTTTNGTAVSSSPQSQAQPPPQLQSQLQSIHHPESSILMLDSQYLDTAASMMLFGTESITASISSLSISSNMPTVQHPPLPQHRPNAVTPGSITNNSNKNHPNHDFSMLLERANNKYDSNISPNALPIVLEEVDDDDFTRPTGKPTPVGSNNIQGTNDDDTNNHGDTSTSCDSSIVILESMEQNPLLVISDDHYHNNNHHRGHHHGQSQQFVRSVTNSMNGRGLAELVGASVHMISKDTFTVSIDVHVAVDTSVVDVDRVDGATRTRPDMSQKGELQQQQQQQQFAMKENILDIIGNPDLLQLWYDAIPSTSKQPQQHPSLIIIRSSEGARNAVHRTQEHNATREYEGEWIEAICPKGFIVPSTSKSTSSSSTSSSARFLSSIGRIFINIAASVAGVIGCPSNSGTVSMFVERSIGQVSMTLSPFPGNIQVCHRIKVIAAPNQSGKIRIEDTVRLRYDDERQSSNSTFSCCDALWENFLPSIDDYVDQVLSSMARLRFLIENGEDGNNRDFNNRYDCGVNDGAHCDETLLLSTWMGTQQQISSNNGTDNNNSTNPLLTRLL